MYLDQVSFGVLTFNRKFFLNNWLKTLEETTNLNIGELIIIDRSSTDGTSELISHFHEKHPDLKFTHIVEEQSLNRALGWNEIRETAEFDWTFMSHDDAYFLNGWNERIDSLTEKFKVILFGGFFMWMSCREAWELVGEFDAKFIDGKFEDLDWFTRMNDLSIPGFYKSIPYPETKLVHDYLRSRSEVTLQYGKEARLHFIEKYGRDPQPIF